MSQSFVVLNIFFFALMGFVALAQPARITNLFALPTLPPGMRNEVRAVYGGFGLAIAGLLGAALILEDIRAGVLLTVGIALWGMASGRLVSFALDRAAPRNTVISLLIEFGLGGSLLYAAGKVFG